MVTFVSSKDFIIATKDANEIDTDKFKHHSRDLVTRGRTLINEMKYEQDVQVFLDRGDEILSNIRNDELLLLLRERAGIVAQDLVYTDDKGVSHLDREVLDNMRRVIIPVIAEAIKYIPIPRIEDSNSKREYAVDNIVVCGYDIVPENISVRLEYDSDMSIRELETQTSGTKLVITIKHIRTELKDLWFYFKRKSFPKVEEQGRVTVRLTGKGAQLAMTFNVKQEARDKRMEFVDGTTDFDIYNLDIDFDKSTLKHDVLVPMITNMFKSSIIRGIERGVEKALTKTINDVGARVTDLIISSTPRFSQQFEHLRERAKKGEFGHRYHKRQEKLE